jgi:hypothetical protein
MRNNEHDVGDMEIITNKFGKEVGKAFKLYLNHRDFAWIALTEKEAFNLLFNLQAVLDEYYEK